MLKTKASQQERGASRVEIETPPNEEPFLRKKVSFPAQCICIAKRSFFQYTFLSNHPSD